MEALPEVQLREGDTGSRIDTFYESRLDSRGQRIAGCAVVERVRSGLGGGLWAALKKHFSTS
jgi:hypothetical protein